MELLVHVPGVTRSSNSAASWLMLRAIRHQPIAKSVSPLVKQQRLPTTTRTIMTLLRRTRTWSPKAIGLLQRIPRRPSTLFLSIDHGKALVSTPCRPTPHETKAAADTEVTYPAKEDFEYKVRLAFLTNLYPIILTFHRSNGRARLTVISPGRPMARWPLIAGCASSTITSKR